MVTKEILKEGLRELGLYSGMRVNVHTSLSAFGYVEGGADTVVDVLMELVTSDGTLMMPTFNHGTPYEKGQIFDVHTTPSVSGIINDTFWRRDGVRRSLSCTHAFAVWGKDADDYVADHHKDRVCGPMSPLGKMYRDDGYVLLLGVDYGSNTFHHFVEESFDPPCLEMSHPYEIKGWNGETMGVPTWNWRNGSCPFNDPQHSIGKPPRYTEDMDAAGIAKKTQIGNATVTLFKMRDAFDVIAKNLKNGAYGFPPCSGCNIRPAKNNWSNESNSNASRHKMYLLAFIVLIFQSHFKFKFSISYKFIY